jgi:hypothetical protein
MHQLRQKDLRQMERWISDAPARISVPQSYLARQDCEVTTRLVLPLIQLTA